MGPTEAEVRQNLEHCYAAFNRGDFDTAIGFAHPDIEVIPAGGQTPRRGAAAMRAWMEPDAFEWQEFDLGEITIQGDKALVRQLMRARGTGSGIDMELDLWTVWTFDADGLWIRVQGFAQHEEAAARDAAALTT